MTRASFTELARGAKRALIIGVGGGGDVIQSIPVGNHLKLLGVEEVIVGGVGSSWWMPEGSPISRDPTSMTYGPTVYDVHRLSHAETWVPGIVGVERRSGLGAQQPAEAVLADLLPGTPFVASLADGVIGLRDALRALIAARAIDLVVGVDIGSDSFHDGTEVIGAQTSLIDFMVIGALTQLDVPVVYALAGYGADGEMQLEELDERVGRVMKAGGFLGAIGLTHRDVEEMLAACALYPDPIEHYAALAARGEFGYRKVQTNTPWGHAVKITPLAALILFFDPAVMVAEACRGVTALKETTSIAEAEEIYANVVGELPETRLEPVVRFMKPQKGGEQA
ncbi:hypothetical protein GGR25_004745 [Kaistia hirudinis]|uniref:DUF1152 domain-containing protein n=1 Tax=Kaistia hirudinis TaxID=1293440 RepID=A0A840AVG2_9HYPH|nr:DUF1152 domain-containing protein [Kaistia hirudinis]MBB3933672.1 hypothetical protein [Kaistia hirudinis]